MKFDKFTQDLFAAKFELSPEISCVNEAVKADKFKTENQADKTP